MLTTVNIKKFMEECAFCKIVNEKRILKEGNFVYVIFSNPRLVEGHLLVIPKRHVYALNELTIQEKAEIFDMLVEFQSKIIKKVSEGCDIRLNYKPYVKNSTTHVSHIHFHLLPRKLNDEIEQKAEKFKNQLYQELSKEEISKISKFLL